MRINIRLQPSFIHRNTIYTDGGGSYKLMFEKIGGGVDAQGQRKSDYAARAVLLSTGWESFWKTMFFFQPRFG